MSYKIIKIKNKLTGKVWGDDAGIFLPEDRIPELELENTNKFWGWQPPEYITDGNGNLVLDETGIPTIAKQAYCLNEIEITDYIPSYSELRLEEYNKEGITPSAIAIALIERLEGNTTDYDTIRAKRAEIKAKYPKPS